MKAIISAVVAMLIGVAALTLAHPGDPATAAQATAAPTPTATLTVDAGAPAAR